MPKIIFTSHYMKDAPPAQLENYVRYIATREGVGKMDEGRQEQPATIHQKKLIYELIRDIPTSKEMLEYADFLLHPTIQNASEFIACAIEQNLDLTAKRENYVDYIANRPRVERVGGHGLFTDSGQPVILAKVQEEVVNHKGPVWTHVISLRREDAARLGYDNARQWMALLRSKRAMLCRHMKIDSARLRWYAAFHNEGHHPHVHLMVYSAKDNDGFLTEKSIASMRSELVHDIFRQDFAHIYEEQNQARAELKSGAANLMRELMAALCSGTLASLEIAKDMELLAGRLQRTGGKKVYGYLKRDVKNLIDQIVDELAKDNRVNALYQAWGKWNDEVLLTYQKTVPSLPPLSQQSQFKSIKNMVIAEAMMLGGGHFTFEDEQMPEPGSSDKQWGQAGTATYDYGDDTEPDFAENDNDTEQELSSHKRDTHTTGGFGNNTLWSNRYKRARKYLFGGGNSVPDFAKAYDLFQEEAESGNPLAMHDLGRMLADGLGREIDVEAAQIWYARALAAFHAAEQMAEERQRPYLQYRIGKMYAAGLGTEREVNCPTGIKDGSLGRDYKKAAFWFSKSVSFNYKYAQYSLAGLYYRGQGVEQSYGQAFHLYSCSAAQENPYASYELAKMCRDGIGTEKDLQLAGVYFEDAFSGFFQLEKNSHDDKLQYRLGQMLHTGTGTKQDDEAAARYWERSAKLGNVNAQYALGKLWLESGTGNTELAVEWITKAADGGNAAAQYSLGKMYRDGEAVSRDICKAVELFTLSAEQNNDYAAFALGNLCLSGEEVPRDVAEAVKWLSLAASLGNQFAQYKLGKLYLSGEDIAKNIPEALKLLHQSAEQKNQFAQYALGKLYLSGREVPLDKEQAIPLLQASAAQGNIYAQFLLEHLDSFQDPSAFLAATRLLHRLENLFREDVCRNSDGASYRMDRKRRRRLAEKKKAQGHKGNDQEPKRQQTY